MEENKGRLEFVDILKGIAILMVVIVHTSQKVTGIPHEFFRVISFGETCCQLFFVLTGYALTYSANKRHVPLKEYYKKRWMSIAPPYYIAVVFWSLLGYLQYRLQYAGGFGYNGSFREILCNLFLLNGLFSEGNNNIVPGGWYVGALVILYALYPLVHQITVSLYRKSKVLLSGFYLVLYAVSEIVVYLNRTDRFTSLVLNANCFLHQLSCLVMGIIVFYCLKDHKSILLRNREKVCLGTLLLLPLQVLSYYLLSVATRDLVSGIFFGGVLMICALYHEQIRKYRFARLLEALGKKSYEIFFVHVIFSWYFIPAIQGLILNDTNYMITSVVYYIVSVCIWLPVIYLLAAVYQKFWKRVWDRFISFVLQCMDYMRRLHKKNYDLRKE